MTLQQSFEFLNFWIGKETGSYYTISELTEVVYRGMMSLYEDLQPKYATSQRIKDALAPFKKTYNFTPTDTVSGYIVIPSDSNYLNLLDVQIQYQISNRTVYYGVSMVNEDVRVSRLNSQISPVTITSPLGEMQTPRYIRLYPVAGYTGSVTYLRKPVKPYFAYTVISGRVIVYDDANSVQIEFAENWQNAVLIKALSSIGINLSDQQVSQYAELKSASNYQSINMV